MRVACIFVICALLSACAFAPKEKITETSFDYNLAFERAQNEMFLLNIARASERRPMYFTAINALRGNLQSSVATGNIAIPFGGGSSSAYSAAPNASYTTNPTFDVAVLDSKQFWLGILTPVPLTTFKYYWDQGWPQELLLFLFIRTIEINGVSYDNYPSDDDKMKSFAGQLRNLFRCGPVKDPGSSTGSSWRCKLQVEEDEPDAIGRPLSKEEIGNVRNLAEIDKAGLKLDSDECSGKYRLVSKKKSLHIASSPSETQKRLRNAQNELCAVRDEPSEASTNLRDALKDLNEGSKGLSKTLAQVCGDKSQPGAGPELGDAQKQVCSLRETLPELQHQLSNAQKRYSEGPKASSEIKKQATDVQKSLSDLQKQVSEVFCIGTTKESTCKTKVYFRSPEAMLYYLGEVVRRSVQPESPDQKAHDVEISYCAGGTSTPLFKVRTMSGDDQNSVVAVSYDGTRYFIPRESSTSRCTRPLTLETLKLVAQLFAQQKDSTELPVTGVVNVIGPLPSR
jgi:hypothetical protein